MNHSSISFFDVSPKPTHCYPLESRLYYHLCPNSQSTSIARQVILCPTVVPFHLILLGTHQHLRHYGEFRDNHVNGDYCYILTSLRDITLCYKISNR